MDFLISYILFIVHPSPNADGLDIAPDIAIYPDEAYVSRPPDSGPLNLGPPPSDTMVH